MTYALLNDVAGTILDADSGSDVGPGLDDEALSEHVQATTEVDGTDEDGGTRRFAAAAATAASASKFMMPTAKALPKPQQPSAGNKGSTAASGIDVSAAARDQGEMLAADASHQQPPPIASSIGLNVEGLSPIHVNLVELTRVVASALSGVGRDKATKKEKKLNKDIEEHPPTATISQEALAWAPNAAASVDSLRTKWPLAGRFDFDFGDFREYLVATKGLKLVSANVHVQKLQYLYGMFDFDSHEFSHIAFVANLYKTKLFDELLKLPVLQPHFSTTLNIATALSHLCDFALLECGRRNLKEAKRCITLLKNEVLALLRKRAHKERAASSARKSARDGESIENMPPPDVLKAAIKLAMIDLNTLLMVKQDHKDLDWQTKYAANVMMAGIIFTNGYAGRPGEWSKMTRQKIEKFIASGTDCLVIEEHKTARIYGPLGRWVSPGTQRAMETMLKIHDRESVLFMDPAKSSASAISMASVLKRFGAVYMPDFTPPLPTLMRKWFHTSAEADTSGKAKQFEALCSMDGHSVKTGKKIYVVGKPAKQAAAAKAIFANFVGDPVAWPSVAELAGGRAESEARIQLNFYRQPAANEADDRYEDDDHNDDEDDDERLSDGDVCYGKKKCLPSPAGHGAASSSAAGPTSQYKVACEGAASRRAQHVQEYRTSAKKRKHLLEASAGKFIKHGPRTNALKSEQVEDKGLPILLADTVQEAREAAPAAAPRELGSAPQAASAVADPAAMHSAACVAVPAFAQPKRGRQGPFTEDQKDYIASQCFACLASFVKGKSPSNVQIGDILSKGVAAGRLPKDATLEQVRQVARTRQPNVKDNDAFIRSIAQQTRNP